MYYATYKIVDLNTCEHYLTFDEFNIQVKGKRRMFYKSFQYVVGIST